jgi:hypothetical protein
MMRAALELTATNAEHEGAEFEYSAISVSYGYPASFDFRASTMRPLFEYGYECAQAGRLWVSSPRTSDQATVPAGDGRSSNVRCPADDEFIGRAAAR